LVCTSTFLKVAKSSTFDNTALCYSWITCFKINLTMTALPWRVNL